MKVLPGNLFWNPIKMKKGWLCEESVYPGRARIVSPDDIRMANGSTNVMLEKMDRLTSDEFIRKGDILGVSRNGLYEHYAVYIGNGRVIHYCGQGDDFGGSVTIHEAPFEEFIKDSKTYFVVWFDNGIPVKMQKETNFLFTSVLDYHHDFFQRKNETIYSAEETVRRAKSRIGEEQYNLVSNNCEHFAMWCKTGVPQSSQVNQLYDYVKFAGIGMRRPGILTELV